MRSCSHKVDCSLQVSITPFLPLVIRVALVSVVVVVVIFVLVVSACVVVVVMVVVLRVKS